MDEFDEAVVAERYLETDEESVWEAWTSAERLADWWWPMFDDASYELDPQPDGVFRFSSSSGGVGVVGQYVEVEAPRLLAFTWIWTAGYEGDAPRVERVSVTIEPRGEYTFVAVSQTAPLAEQPAVLEGWEDSLTRLEELFLDG